MYPITLPFFHSGGNGIVGRPPPRERLSIFMSLRLAS